MTPPGDQLSHIRSDGTAAMVDVSHKPDQKRTAKAQGFIRMAASTIAAIAEGNSPKGDVLGVARVAGIRGAKKTAELVPLCHPLPLSQVIIDFDVRPDGIAIACFVKTTGKTGVEMEALCGVQVAALTLFDMCKAIDKDMQIEDVMVSLKTKG